MSIPLSTGSTGTAAANADVAITYAASTNECHVIHDLSWSYDGSPTAGGITITDGGTTVFQADIRAAGPDSLFFDPPRKAKKNSAVVVTLAAGAAGVVGKLNVGHTKEF